MIIFQISMMKEKIYVKLNTLKTDPAAVHVSAGVSVRAIDNCFVEAGTNEHSKIKLINMPYNEKFLEKLGLSQGD